MAQPFGLRVSAFWASPRPRNVDLVPTPLQILHIDNHMWQIRMWWAISMFVPAFLAVCYKLLMFLCSDVGADLKQVPSYVVFAVFVWLVKRKSVFSY